ncbi:VTT domain-containing protein [uncultured Croceicoccus sp.]|uniref:TVP38/TMEM64 family protein n=1 Tax=uncultured Croceicoccus sp. TaxID=1295329 RepID=UPI002636BA53|nr:VTT domain-containing protein [uncultured Croceicoccus sp.]
MDGLTEILMEWARFVQDPVMLAIIFLVGTTALVACCVPGVILPATFSSAALLGGWQGGLIVALGALLGSHILFVVTRHGMRARVRDRLGDRLDGFERQFERRGLLYIIGLRVAGTPHFLVTGASALSTLNHRSFAFATMIGFLPAIAMTAAAGSVI